EIRGSPMAARLRMVEVLRRATTARERVLGWRRQRPRDQDPAHGSSRLPRPDIADFHGRTPQPRRPIQGADLMTATRHTRSLAHSDAVEALMDAYHAYGQYPN